MGVVNLPMVKHRFFVCGGFNHTISLDQQGFVWSWGSNSSQQLGRNCTDSQTHTPEIVEGLSNIAQISCGGDFAAAVDHDGKLWMFGKIAGMETLTTPKQLAPKLQFMSVYCGAYHALFITTEGSLWGCGDNNENQLGLSKNPKGIVYLNQEDVASAACGGHVTLLLKNDGKIYGTGKNHSHQLTGTKTYVNFTRLCEELENIVLIGAGWAHTLFLREDGVVFGLGKNTSGELGLEGDGYDSCLTPKQLTLPPIITFNCGLNHSVFLDYENNVWTCGFTGGGRTGTPEHTGRAPSIAISDCIGISYGGNTTFVQQSDRSFMVFGRNDYGQLGYDKSTKSEFLVPTVFPFPEVIGTNISSSLKSARK